MDNKIVFNTTKKLESKQMSLEELIPELTPLLAGALKDKEEIKEEIKKEILNNSLGPQFNAVRVCNFPMKKPKGMSEEDDEYCEHYKICPMFVNQIRESINTKCLFEMQKAEQLTNELINDLGINPMTDATDKRMLGELITYSLIEDRAVANLACNSLQHTSITYGKNGITYEKMQNFNLQTIQTMNNLKTKVREKLVATRMERTKLNIEKQKTVNADGVKKMKDKLREIENKLKPNAGIGLIIKEKNNKTEVVNIERPFEEKEVVAETVELSFEDMFK